jgi:GMP reductase
MKINADIKLDFDDVLLVPQRTITASRKQVQTCRDFQFYHSSRIWSGIPIVAANMDTTGTFSMAESLSKQKIITCLHKHYSLKEHLNKFGSWAGLWPTEYTWYSLGIKDRNFDQLCAFIDGVDFIPNICIDVANGYTDDFVKFCEKVRKNLGTTPIIMAGNVCTPEMVQELILHGGIDIVKIGIGPGSVCTTRLKTGVGYPQLSAIIECAHAAHGLKSSDKRLGLICADGGCRCPADVCKAFCANSDFVMLGGLLAGTEECDGEWIYNDDRKSALSFYGMSSETAQKKHGNGLKNYTASEGRVKQVAYKGRAKDVVEDILGGLRSCCSYIGATCLKDMGKCAEFVRVSRVHFDKSIG